MVKAVNTFLGCLLISASAFAGPTSLDCEAGSKFENNLNELEKVASEVDECPAPKEEQFKSVCTALVQNYDAKNPDSGLSFSYQERIWELSCAKPGKDSLDQAKTKIQKMWNKNKELFRCKNFPTVSALSLIHI